MTRILRRARRRAYTLIELLVAMAVIVVLASIALLIVPDILDNDRTTEGAALARQYLMIAKSRAARDQAPRGIRLIVGIDPTNVAKTNVGWVTELQYIEKLPVFIPTNPGLSPTDPNAPCIRFVYSYDAAGNEILTAPNAPQCWIDNLLPGDAAIIQQAIPPLSASGGLLTVYSLGFSARITSVLSTTQGSAGPGTTKFVVSLDKFPDSQLGAAGTAGQNLMHVFVSYEFGITTPARPLIGEPTLQLPRNICIDLTSSPGLNVNPASGSVDIVFLPSGQIDPSCDAGSSGSNQVFMWVRDYTKPGGLAGNFQQGGEQQVLSLKTKTASLGTFPINWDSTNPFLFAMQGATAP